MTEVFPTPSNKVWGVFGAVAIRRTEVEDRSSASLCCDFIVMAEVGTDS